MALGDGNTDEAKRANGTDRRVTRSQSLLFHGFRLPASFTVLQPRSGVQAIVEGDEFEALIDGVAKIEATGELDRVAGAQGMLLRRRLRPG